MNANMKKMLSVLTPEQQDAFNFFYNSLSYEQTMINNPILTIENICTTNTCFFTSTFLDTTTLPRESYWLWNKSKRSQTVYLDDNTKVSFYKLNTRKARRSEKEPPNFKVWLFDITSTSGSKIHFFWCERGFDTVEITINDLAFLRPYFTTNSAASLYGWM